MQNAKLEFNFAFCIFNFLANVLFYVFTTNIGEIAEGAKPEKDKLVVEGIEFTKWRRVEAVTKQGEMMLKGAGAGNECAN